MKAFQTAQHLTRGTAATITITEQHKGAIGKILITEIVFRIHKFFRSYTSRISIRRRKMRKDTRTVDALPLEGMVWKLSGIVP